MIQQRYGRAGEFFGRCVNQTDDLNVQVRGLIQLAVVDLQFFARSIVVNPDDQLCIYGRAQAGSGYFKSMERMIYPENLSGEHHNRHWDLLQSQVRCLEQEFRLSDPRHDQLSVIAGFTLGVYCKIRRQWDKASRYFEQVSRQTSNRMIQAHAKYELGLLSCNLEPLTQAASQKDDLRIQALAKLELGKMHRLGTCVKANHFNASVFFQQVIDEAADLAVKAEALMELALMFEDGMNGFPTNYRKALSYFEQRADQDHSPYAKHVALYKLGDIYEHGRLGVTKDLSKETFRKNVFPLNV
jgi:tetratricopeptide (TPR) repeat protein